MSNHVCFASVAYVRTEDGILASTHDTVAFGGTGHRVVTFNLGKNTNQESLLRLIDPGAEGEGVRIEGIDDEEYSPGDAVVVEVPAKASPALDAVELECGRECFTDAFDTGMGKWLLMVTANRPIEGMSLLFRPSFMRCNVTSV